MTIKLFQVKPSQDIALNNVDSVNIKNKRYIFWNLETQNYSRNSKWWNLSYIPIFVILILLFLVVLLPLLDQVDLRIQYLLNKQLSASQDVCSFEIVETIPEGLIYPNYVNKHPSTFETWKKLIQIAEHSIKIGSFYWTLSQSENFPKESWKGGEIYNDLLDAGLKRNISIKIAENEPSDFSGSNDTNNLIRAKAASVKYLNFTSLLGSGVLHSKFWIVDEKHFYVGSANLDWRALTQVKEIGVAFYNCSSVAEDLSKIFEVYWTVGNKTDLPKKWPNYLSTVYNSKNPFEIQLNDQKQSLFISSSPPKFSPMGRNDDLEALLGTIKNAKKFVHISVMEYLPLNEFSKPIKYWPEIDDELKRAVIERKVKVRLLASRWKHTKSMTYNFLRSLAAVSKFRKSAVIEIKMFEVPSDSKQSEIPFARVNHNKYMVTDNGAFIGTSNWSGDYFVSTAGVSLVFPSKNGSENIVQRELEDIFDRDWNSEFAKSVDFSMIQNDFD